MLLHAILLLTWECCPSGKEQRWERIIKKQERNDIIKKLFHDKITQQNGICVCTFVINFKNNVTNVILVGFVRAIDYNNLKFNLRKCTMIKGKKMSMMSPSVDQLDHTYFVALYFSTYSGHRQILGPNLFQLGWCRDNKQSRGSHSVNNLVSSCFVVKECYSRW